MEFDGFDWDSANQGKCQKHGVSIAEIESLFGGTPLVGPDAKHSGAEQRSARYMHEKEVETHEKEIPGLQDRR